MEKQNEELDDWTYVSKRFKAENKPLSEKMFPTIANKPHGAYYGIDVKQAVKEAYLEIVKYYDDLGCEAIVAEQVPDHIKQVLKDKFGFELE